MFKHTCPPDPPTTPGRSERGLTNSTQAVLVFPLVFGALLLTLQWAMTTWAETTALAAAQDAARAASAIGANTTAGQQAGGQAASNGSLDDVHITVTKGPTTTTATITANSITVIPGWQPAITKTAQAPTERLTTS